MSASREKKLRKAAQAEQAGKKKQSSIEGESWQKNTTIAVCSLIALIILFVIVLGSGIPQRIFTALTIGTEKISVAEYNFYLYSNANNYVSSMKSYGMSTDQLGLDLEQSLDDQECPYTSGTQKGSWGDYFRTQTNSSLEESTALYLEAKANGVSLPAETQTSIDNSIANLKDYCKANDTTLSKYLTTNYGKGVNEAVLRRALERSNLASYYSGEKEKSFTYTNEQVTGYYDSHKADIDVVDYRSFAFSGKPATKTDSSGNTVEATDEEKKAAMDAAKQKADEMLASVTTETSFGLLASQYAAEDQKDKYADADATLTKAASASQLGEDMKNWLFDDSRKAGDKNVIASDTDYTVVYMVKRYRQDENTVNVRHILIEPEKSEGADTATDAQKAAAKEKAEALYEQWKSGEATEDSFAKLAEENSADTGSASNGGLYENVYSGESLEEAFKDWCFDASRKPGDTGIVETSYGYHIMYFAGVSDPYWMVKVRNELRSSDYNSYVDEIKKKHVLKENSFGLSLSGTK